MINRRNGIRAMKRGLLAVFLVFTISAVSQAGPIGVDIDPFPVIAVGGINVSYNALTGAFAANGFAQTLDLGGGLGPQTINAPFRILATIDSSGKATNGNLTVGSVTSPYLSGSMGAGVGGFAFQGGTLEFLFGAIGGSYVPGTFSATKPVDVMLSVVGGSYAGSFASSWSSSFNTAQIKEDPPIPNPEPSVLLLMLVGGGGLCWQLRKRGVPV
jgi:hypothetical protein